MGCWWLSMHDRAQCHDYHFPWVPYPRYWISMQINNWSDSFAAQKGWGMGNFHFFTPKMGCCKKIPHNLYAACPMKYPYDLNFVLFGCGLVPLDVTHILHIRLHHSYIRHNTTEPLQWRHNEHDGVSNHQPHDCLPNRLFSRRSKKTSKLWVTGLCKGNSPVTSEFPAQRASNAENASIWWRHRAKQSRVHILWDILQCRITLLQSQRYFVRQSYVVPIQYEQWIGLTASIIIMITWYKAVTLWGQKSTPLVFHKTVYN